MDATDNNKYQNVKQKQKKKIRFTLPNTNYNKNPMNNDHMNNNRMVNRTYSLSKNTFDSTGEINQSESDFDRDIRMIILGNSYVGKSAFIFRYTTGQFCHPYLPTVGYDHAIKYVVSNNTREKVRLELWDTSGAECMRNEMSKTLFAMISCFIIMYDVTDIESFHDVGSWMALIKKYGIDNRQVLVLGNKTDLKDDRTISKDDGIKLAEKYNAKFMEISVRRNHNINKTMSRILEHLCEASQIKK